MSKISSIARYAKKVVKRELDFRSGKLTSAAFDLTHRCNLKCEMCSLWSTSSEEDELPLADWMRVVDELAEVGVDQISVNGGEPTIVQGFWDLVRHIKSKGISVCVYTNALSMSKYVNEFGTLVDTVNLSVDAADERHDKIRGLPGALDLTLKGAEAIIRYRQEHGNQATPVVNMHATLSRSNIDGICDIVKLGDEMGVDVVSFQYISCCSQAQVDNSKLDGICVASDRFTCEDQESLLLDDEGVRVFREQVAKLPTTKRSLVMMEPTKHLSDGSLKTGKFPVKRCAPMMNRLVIRPNGDTSVCAHITGYSLGNVREKSIGEIWAGEERVRIVGALGHRLMPVCQCCCAFSTTLTVGQLARIAMGRRI